jgi:hypothetical protein
LPSSLFRQENKYTFGV